MGAATFGKFNLIERIAIGGMAEVWLAESDSLSGINRRCAIKRILQPHCRDLHFVSMFIDEARITIGLDHENIVRLYDFGQHEGSYYIAMEYVAGTDLAHTLRALFSNKRHVPVRIAAYIARQLCLALSHAHEKVDHKGDNLGIVHRDISPQNVLLSYTGEVKLTDFGIAAARNKLTRTLPGTILGKSAYMAPEHARGKRVDLTADIWAAGVLLWEMVTGQRLFATDSPAATVARVLACRVERPSSIDEHIPRTIDDICLRALRVRPKDRFQSAREMADALEEILRDQPADAKDLAVFIADLPSQKKRITLGGSTKVSPVDTTLLGANTVVDNLIRQLKKSPDLWTLVRMGEELQIKDPTRSVSALRCAAAVFAHRGLLVQAIAAYHGARDVLDAETVFADFVKIAKLRPGIRADLTALITGWQADEFWQILCSVDPKDLGSNAQSKERLRTPLFGYLSPEEFAEVASKLKVCHAKDGEVIVTEGELGNALFGLAHGRVVVHCRPERVALDLDPGLYKPTTIDEPTSDQATSEEIRRRGRIYLSALSDGDFFGEFSFLTKNPRSASVEAIADTVYLKVDRDLVHGLSADIKAPLRRFYKERVVELLMAKSSVFHLVRPIDRKEILERATYVEFKADDMVIEEGAVSDSLYFIRRGEVEVFHDDDGIEVFVNKLGQGQFFGEISAIRGSPRTMSVRAMGKLGVFRFDQSEVERLLKREPGLREAFESTIERRAAESDERLREFERVLRSI